MQNKQQQQTTIIGLGNPVKIAMAPQVLLPQKRDSHSPSRNVLVNALHLIGIISKLQMFLPQSETYSTYDTFQDLRSRGGRAQHIPLDTSTPTTQNQ